MPVERTPRGGSAPQPQRRASDPVRDKADAKAEPRSLIVSGPKQAKPSTKPSRYADALFLAHVFASKFDAPQQREKRRADPADANVSYRKSAKRPTRPGRVLSKKI